MERKGSRIVWNSPSWRLRVDTLLLADGSTVEKGTVDHPGAVVLVPLRETRNGPEVLMLRQYRLSLDDTILELPAGTRGWNEDWIVCAQRELREETGFRAETFASLGEIWPVPGYTNEVMALYLARGLSPDPLTADADEVITVEPRPLAELVAMAQDGRLRDAKSIVAILRAAAHLDRKD